MSNYLPPEIWIEILERVPVKSLVKCTGVCKSWRSLITDPTFILDHLHRTIDDGHEFRLVQLCNKGVYPDLWPPPVRYSLRFDYGPLDEFSTLDLPRVFDMDFYVVGICNGLVCLASNREFYSLCICNPCIRRYVSLPKPTDYRSLNSRVTCMGFGFDSRNNDYKVIRIVNLLDDRRSGVFPTEVELYSLATGVWKNITPIATVFSVTCGLAPYAFMNRILHWGASRVTDDSWYNFVLSFDFEDEVFDEIMLPQDLADASSHNVITVIGGGKSLAVYQESRWLFVSHIWVMEEYGHEGSWNKMFTFNLIESTLEIPLWGVVFPEITGILTVLCYRKNGEVLLLVDEWGFLYSLDIDSKKLTELGMGRGGHTWYLCSGYYAESLVLLNKASSLVSY